MCNQSTVERLKRWLTGHENDEARFRINDLHQPMRNSPRLIHDVGELESLASTYEIAPPDMLAISKALLAAPLVAVCHHHEQDPQGGTRDCLGDLQLVMRPNGTYLECKKDATHTYKWP